MSKIRWAVRALLPVVLGLSLAPLTGCEAGKAPSSSTGTAKGRPGEYYFVNLFTPPVGGVLTSSIGGIACGASSLGTATPDANGVLQNNPVYYGPGTTPSWPTVSSMCGLGHQTRVAWADSVVLTATPLGGNAFIGWAGDCSGRSTTCTLVAGADKTVVAIFGPPGSGHPNFSDPAIHAPAYSDFLTNGDGAALACTACHGASLQGQGIAPSCTACHGTPGSGACTSCHGYAPATGAHRAHFGLTGTEATGGYGETTVLQDRYPGSTPTEAPGVYAFGCGLCHPTDLSGHRNGSVDVVLYEATATGLKALAAPTASYDRATGTCSGVYCHSSGQQSPVYAVTPAWTSTAPLGCGGCHGNPPRYLTGGPGAATANSHLGQLQDGSEYGHVLGLPMPTVGIMKHGGWYGSGSQSAPITCQTCHFDTTDPSSTAPGRFYWLDTSGNYDLGGGNGPYFACTSCHMEGSTLAPTGTGRVLPLRHVNGSREVVFDPRTTLPPTMSPFLPPAPSTPTKPYWFTDSNGAVDYDRTIVSWTTLVIPGSNTGTIHFDLTAARYDQATKSCSNVGCHQAQGSTNYNPGGTGPVTSPLIPLTWGDPYLLYGGCSKCHPNY